MNITFDLITGLAGSGRLAFAKAFQATQQNTQILFSPTNFRSAARSAQNRTQAFFHKHVLRELERGQNIVFVTDLCDDLLPARDVIAEIQRSIVTHCRTPVAMNVIHIQPPEPKICIEELLRRYKPITGQRVRQIQKGFDLFRAHGPCYPDAETLVLSPLSSADGTMDDAVDALMCAKGRRKELVFSSPEGKWVTAVTQPPIGVKLMPARRTARPRVQQSSQPAASTSLATPHY